MDGHSRRAGKTPYGQVAQLGNALGRVLSSFEYVGRTGTSQSPRERAGCRGHMFFRHVLFGRRAPEHRTRQPHTAR